MSDHGELVLKQHQPLRESKVMTKTYELKVTVPIEFKNSDGEIVPQHQLEEFITQELAWYESVIGENLVDFIGSEFGVMNHGSFTEVQINEVA